MWLVELIGVICWPIVVGGALYGFREQIAKVLESYAEWSHIKVVIGKASIEMQRTLEEVKRAVDKLPPQPQKDEIKLLVGQVETANNATISFLGGAGYRAHPDVSFK
jgi:hypothetical protein